MLFNNIKKIFFIIILSVFVGVVPVYANIASVNDVHNQIYSIKNITVPIESGINQTDITSVKYVLKQVDTANYILNGESTNYYTGVLSEPNISSTTNVSNYVNTLIVKLNAFKLILTNANAFSLQISSAGTYTIDWGDGISETFTKSASNITYSHTYSATGTYAIQISGTTTAYNSSGSAIAFNSSTNKTKITSIVGSLGAVFPTVGGVNPRFYQTFLGCTGITNIPQNLFSGISGQPVNSMFYNTFSGCTGITKIPPKLFANISGTPVADMFNSTFYNCTGLTGSIPTNLFGTFTGAPISNMFYRTFYGCSGLTSIEDGIWNLAGISNTSVTNMFSGTFYGCSGITSASPTVALGSSVKLYTQFSNYTVGRAFQNCTAMSDYASIPAAWK